MPSGVLWVSISGVLNPSSSGATGSDTVTQAQPEPEAATAVPVAVRLLVLGGRALRSGIA